MIDQQIEKFTSTSWSLTQSSGPSYTISFNSDGTLTASLTGVTSPPVYNGMYNIVSDSQVIITIQLGTTISTFIGNTLKPLNTSFAAGVSMSFDGASVAAQGFELVQNLG